MSARRLFALLLLLLATAPAWALKPFVADYDANWKGVQANAQISLSRTAGDRWTYELVVSNQLGSSRQTTVFEETGGSFRPLSGVDATQVLFKRSQRNATYDWTQREARWSGDVKDDRAGPVKLEDGDLDGMLLNLALVRDVAAGKPLNYRLVDNGVARPQRFQNLGKDTITVAGQPRTATKVARTGDDKQVIVWVVDGLPTPARILQRRDGRDELELTLKSVR
ncbi:DUF3108 domain-containing protein [Thermomonas sp.]|uniref:DUF3108 domain-containing protein n=1 Tax=Thermomonas sp. TaxID=1971895 RepID=UPI00391A3267